MVKAVQGSRWWAGLRMAGLPPLSGYVPTRARPEAETLIATRAGDPILSTWPVGAGRVTALTTEPFGAGTAGWRGWPDYGRWLAEQATLDQIRWFFEQEAAGEAGFDDLVAMTQVKLPKLPKLELARNYWDEMGRGQAAGMHGPMLDALVETLKVAHDLAAFTSTIREHAAVARIFDIAGGFGIAIHAVEGGGDQAVEDADIIVTVCHWVFLCW